jgi:predicted RNase H-like nuclease (RuvC/YqgF family)
MEGGEAVSSDIASVTISKLLAACAEYRDKLSKLEERNAVLEDQEKGREQFLGQSSERETRLRGLLSQLQKDKERVDYVEKHLGLSRDALDVAMEVSKP